MRKAWIVLCVPSKAFKIVAPKNFNFTSFFPLMFEYKMKELVNALC